jgi:cation:H+ antiporter
MEYLFVLLGFVILIISGKYLVNGSVSLARYLRLSTLVIGVTVVAFGTSAPELLVSLQAAIKGHPEISIGNVVGSNISNLALVLGLTAIILPMSISRNTIRVDWPVMMVVSVLFYFFVRNGWLTRFEGIVFNVLLILYVFYSVRYSRKDISAPTKVQTKPTHSLTISILIIVLSSIGLVFGANLLVENASVIAMEMGVSERVISISLIAVGTSLPELATSVMAAIQKETDISVGNIIGSNIFNILSVLGISSIVKPIEVTPIMINIDIVWMLSISALLIFLMMPFKKARLGRIDGIILLLVYLVYIYLLFKTGKEIL